MWRFIQRFSDKITGNLIGFDRLVLRGTIRYLHELKGLQKHATENTEKTKRHEFH
jgi:hypothetical protein